LWFFFLITVNCSKGKSAHIINSELYQHQFLKDPISPEHRSLLFCANENT
jgi:hypothetical protein